jgi:general secretion pathway protein K
MNRQRGIGLVVVLWGVLLLAVLAAEIVALSRSENRLVERHLAAARHAAALHTAVAWAAQRLLDVRSERRLPIDGSPTSFEFAGQHIEVSATLEAGRIDLNNSSDELLGALLRSQGLSEVDATRWLATLRDWQDSDDERRLDGAEWADYRAAGLRYGPRNAPLKSVDELQMLLGMPETLAKCLASASTVYTWAPVPNVQHLTPESRRVLAWADRHQVGSHRWLPENIGGSPESVPLAGQVIRLRIRLFEDAKRTSSVSEVVGRLRAGRGRPWLTIAVGRVDANDGIDCDGPNIIQ